MPKFDVHFEQINHGWIEVTAATKEEAEAKAFRKWRRCVGYPRMQAYDLRPTVPGEKGEETK